MCIPGRDSVTVPPSSTVAAGKAEVARIVSASRNKMKARKASSSANRFAAEVEESILFENGNLWTVMDVLADALANLGDRDNK